MRRDCTSIVCALVTAAAVRADLPSVVYVYNMGSNASERILMASLQGVVARTTPEVHLGETLWLAQLEQIAPGTKIVHSGSPAFFLSRYRPLLAGYVLCDAATRNIGTSVAGALGAVLVDASTEHYATTAGLPMLSDVRGQTSAWAYAIYGPSFSREYLFHQAPSFTHQLRDFAVYHAGFMFHEDPAWETYYENQDDHSLVFGWAPSEFNFFQRASVTNTLGVPADWLENASVLSQWNVPLERQRNHAPECAETDPDVHYVAFVMSDGDNVQWLNGNFFNAPWWGSPHRGSFTMNWDMSPSFADINPIGFNYYYRTAWVGEHQDSFVTASGPGVMYPSQYPDIAGFAEVNAAMMERVDQRVISILDNALSVEKLSAILADERVMGMMLKIGDAYRGGGGQVRFFHGKPCVTVKYSLWDRFDTPDSLVASLNSARREPRAHLGSYSVVNVHPWSTGHLGDPMSNVRSVVERLDADVRVVTLEELIVHIRNNFGAPACVPCAADRNADGVVNSQDFFDYLACFFDQGACGLGDADFNLDGVVGSQDFFDFLNAFFAGCQ